MRLTVDHARCTGHGRCYTMAPDLLSCDDEGFVTVRGTTTDVPLPLEAQAVAAQRACPEDAITVE